MQDNKFKLGWLTFGRREITYYVLVGVFVSFSLWAWGYITLLNSSDYAFAQTYLNSNQTVKDVLGEIKSSRLGFVNFKQSYSSGNWTSKFQVILEGSKASGEALLKMKSSESGWQVEEATLETNGQSAIKL